VKEQLVPQTRRHFLAALPVVGLATTGLARADRPLHIATNQYPWLTFFGRDKRSWDRDLTGSVADVARAGLLGLEPIATSVEQIKTLAPILKKHDLQMRSLYVNSTLHERKTAAESIRQVLSIADAARPIGCTILVTNPSPIRWGGPESKSDEQLKIQAENLDKLGAELRKREQVLAYHNHDAELRHAAREFHHMMLGTNPRNVSLCLDAHWVFRGAGDSQVALFDVVKLYGKRIVELHLRQSHKGVWTEVFGEGDIDHQKLVAMLVERAVKPHLVLEQAVEARTPKTMDAVAAHPKGLAYARKVFARLG
jgi:inosose dehydratase